MLNQKRHNAVSTPRKMQIPNLFWTSVSYEDLRSQPKFVALPEISPSSLVGHQSFKYVQQSTELWDILHTGVLTTGLISGALGFYEPHASRILGIREAVHEKLLQVHRRIHSEAEVPWDALSHQAVYAAIAENDEKVLSYNVDKLGNNQLLEKEGSPADPIRLKAGIERQHHISASAAGGGIGSVRCAWGQTQEAAALSALLDIAPHSILQEVGMMAVTPDNMPHGWPDTAYPLPRLAASPDAIIAHVISVDPQHIEPVFRLLEKSLGHPAQSMLSASGIMDNDPLGSSSRKSGDSGLGVGAETDVDLSTLSLGEFERSRVLSGQGGVGSTTAGSSQHSISKGHKKLRKESAAGVQKGGSSSVAKLENKGAQLGVEFRSGASQVANPNGGRANGQLQNTFINGGMTKTSLPPGYATKSVAMNLRVKQSTEVRTSLQNALGSVRFYSTPRDEQGNGSGNGDQTKPRSGADRLGSEDEHLDAWSDEAMLRAVAQDLWSALTLVLDASKFQPCPEAVQGSQSVVNERANSLAGERKNKNEELPQPPQPSPRLIAAALGHIRPNEQNGSETSSARQKIVVIREVVEVKNTCPFAEERPVSGRRPRDARSPCYVVSDRGPRERVEAVWVPQLQLEMMAAGLWSALLVSRSATRGIRVFRVHRDDEYLSRMLHIIARMHPIDRKAKPSLTPPALKTDAQYTSFVAHTLRIAKSAQVVVETDHCEHDLAKAFV